jgi:hypothetical protein
MDQFKGMMADLAQNEIWRAHIERVQAQKPELPPWSGGNGEDNTELWKQRSAQQEGWDLFYQLLTKP